MTVNEGGQGTKCRETVKISKPYYDEWWVAGTSVLQINATDASTEFTPQKGAYGSSSDNAQTEAALADEQKAKAFGFSTSLVDLQLEVGWVDDALDPTYCKQAKIPFEQDGLGVSTMYESSNT